MERLLTKRYSIRPLNPKYTFAWESYINQRASMWTTEEVDLSKDLTDYNKLTDKEQKVIQFILAFFAGSDGLVNVNIGENLISDFGEESLEIATCYRFQAMMEDIHNDMYSLLIDVLIKDPILKLTLFEGIERMPIIQKKAKWAMSKMSADTNKVSRLVAFACVEGIQFSASFCYFYWLKNRNLMPGLTVSNEFISRDEGNHFKFAVEIYHHLDPALKLSNAEILEIVISAAEIEKEFVEIMITEPLYNMNAGKMKTYVEYIADYVLDSFHVPKHYKAQQPFEFMETISLEQKTNFFESRNSVYSKATTGEDHQTFSMDDNF
jgi:ribonucleoside-diphosphate reductase beta chain